MASVADAMKDDIAYTHEAFCHGPALSLQAAGERIRAPVIDYNGISFLRPEEIDELISFVASLQ
eukprot:9355293-Prorocentrum_lima.AAC.1